MIRAILTGASLTALLAGCSYSNKDPVYTAFHREAGALADTGHFGNATMNNHVAMTSTAHHTYNLAQRFASEVMTTVNFAFNSAQLDAGAQDTLREQAHFIKQFPEVRFKVYGHADKVGSEAYNKRLGMARARAVVDFLVGQGISRSRLEAVVSFGETQPIIVTEGRERRNRRTVTEVSGFVEDHPMVLDGKYAQVVYREYVRSATARTTLSGLTGAFGAGGGGGDE
ncbi:OmpA family protein [Cognatishimia sp. F0-27]|uniref:OmpA family protein n=1 Tax=Cognatishimia sp. F0-27 TaxID=2816855 RepID=UPI001D0C652A|nr:OmpA family protein [Cognatishimia sp. F0-27]MCC1492256.1 OmpA family protein [Cognatishimia sp. F0-27]